MGKAAVAVLLGCLALVGCGASDRGADAAAVTEDFHAALASQDGERACRALAPETQSKLEDQEKARCAEAILELDLPRRATPAATSVHVTSAAVSLDQGGKTFLDEFDDGWKVSAAGCRPTAPDLPYDCELKG
jgi:hypothetical protein